jgi:hypothetical protein
MSEIGKLLNCDIFTKKGFQKINLNQTLLESMIQCGASEICVAYGEKETLDEFGVLPPNIKNRIKEVDIRNELCCVNYLEKYLIESTKKEVNQDKDYDHKISYLSYVLSSMLFCASKGLAIAQAGKPLEFNESIKGLFNLETQTNLDLFFSSWEIDSFGQINLKSSIDKRAVFILDEIVKSRQYAKLVEKHSQLRDSSKSKSNTLSEINKLARQLKNNYDKKTALKNATIATINLSKSIPLFGDFINSVGGVVKKVADKTWDKNPRLVMYSQRELMHNLFMERLKQNTKLFSKNKKGSV